MYYECHITIEDPEMPCVLPELKRSIENLGWTFSRIQGDPILGLKTYCYATKHFAAAKKLEHVTLEMGVVASNLKTLYDVVRQKIELVLLDSKEKG